MGQNIIYNDECLSYDEVCERFSYVQDEYSIDEDLGKIKKKLHHMYPSTQKKKLNLC